ncbi:tRNA 2-thiouridine(34) synthase MnmA [Patescibacteria group bacterium]|nr:tRNA 2-thiouridine(34) synthase MnmA [Patescibacteria group bacterium]
MARVFVGLSGGVDSAVAAHLLIEEGHDVTGVFIRGWEPDFLACSGAADRLSAMQVAAHLGIPFRTYDLSEEYKASVVDAFVAEYRAGRTPNPDVLCNRFIKFGSAWERARADGAEYFATGHYADTNGAVLRAARDATKNQTYFLWTLTRADLEHTRFPLGKMLKTEVRALARRVRLPNAARKDSQGLCFLGDVDMHRFLKRYLPSEPGPILYNGATIGTHDGSWFYTLGQHVAASSKERLYVVDKRGNELIVSETPAPLTQATTCTLLSESYVSGQPPQGIVRAEYRYHGPQVRATVDQSIVTFEKPVLVAKGQSVVFYDQQGVVCYGGGIVA